MADIGFRVLQLITPFLSYLPQVHSPDRRVPLRKKIIFTVISLVIFSVCSQLPLYGLHTTTDTDPIYWKRSVLASSRGTVMELGISPIVMAASVMQLLPNLIKPDNSTWEDRDLKDGVNILFGILVGLGQAVLYTLTGMYGSIEQLGVGGAILIIAQIWCGSFVAVYLNGLLTKGYGLGSGISLFIASSTFQSITWKALSPMTTSDARVHVFEGAVIALFHLLITRTDKVSALKEAFFRENLPHLTHLLATVLIFLLVIYFHGLRVILPVRSINRPGHQGLIPIKLFYISNIPIVLLYALIKSQLLFIHQLLHSRFRANFLTNMAASPFSVVCHIIFMLSACALLLKSWMEVSGSSAREVAKQLQDLQTENPSERISHVTSQLNRYILVAAALGGIFIGAITVLADFMGAFASGTGIVLAVTIVSQYSETERGSSLYFYL